MDPQTGSSWVWLRSIGVGLLALLLAGCAETGGRNTEGAGASAPPAGPAAPASPGEGAEASSMRKAMAAHMNPAEVRLLLEENPEILLLDVRQPEEWVPPLGHIDGAVLIPLPELSARLGEIEAWRDRPVVTVCRSGRRSEVARKALVQAGFTSVANMDGGMIEWRRTE